MIIEEEYPSQEMEEYDEENLIEDEDAPSTIDQHHPMFEKHSSHVQSQ